MDVQESIEPFPPFDIPYFEQQLGLDQMRYDDDFRDPVPGHGPRNPVHEQGDWDMWAENNGFGYFPAANPMLKEESQPRDEFAWPPHMPDQQAGEEVEEVASEARVLTPPASPSRNGKRADTTLYTTRGRRRSQIISAAKRRAQQKREKRFVYSGVLMSMLLQLHGLCILCYSYFSPEQLSKLVGGQQIANRCLRTVWLSGLVISVVFGWNWKTQPGARGSFPLLGGFAGWMGWDLCRLVWDGVPTQFEANTAFPFFVCFWIGFVWESRQGYCWKLAGLLASWCLDWPVREPTEEPIGEDADEDAEEDAEEEGDLGDEGPIWR
ncbi:hypothetical protein F5B20DRAFT_578563 [Whalleya microplaca]|nr:hypothetical protein F5B20DRAFT_578563 [Whalleya microplaca]